MSDPISGWSIRTLMSDGTAMDLRGSIYASRPEADVLRYVDAIADGLRRAGFDAAVTIERKEVTNR